MRLMPVAQAPMSASKPNGPAAGQPAPTPGIRIVEAHDDYQEPLIVCTYGEPGSGKSTLAGSGPGTIGLVPTERKSRQSVIRAAEVWSRKVLMPDVDLIRTGNPMLVSILPDVCITEDMQKYKGWKPSEIQAEMQDIASKITLLGPQPGCCKRHYYRWHVNRVKSVAFQFATMEEVKTIVVDTFGQMMIDISYANYGQAPGVLDSKEFGFAPRQDMNHEALDFLNQICCKNVVLTHHAAGVWKDNVPVKGQTKPDCKFNKVGHHTSIMIEQWGPSSIPVGQTHRYGLIVKDCQANASLIGRRDLLYDEDINLPNLALEVYKGSDPAFWGL